MSPQVLQRLLFLFGAGFLVANLLVAVSLLRFERRRRSAILIWRIPKPRFYRFSLGLGVVLAGLFLFKWLVLHRPLYGLFGEAMMLLYYGFVFPMSTRIPRGFYGDGVWSDTGFMPWGQISAVSWKEEEGVILVLISHHRNVARHLHVPGPLYGEARRLLRDKVKAHDIHIGGTGLNLGSRDEQDSV